MSIVCLLYAVEARAPYEAECRSGRRWRWARGRRWAGGLHGARNGLGRSPSSTTPTTHQKNGSRYNVASARGLGWREGGKIGTLTGMFSRQNVARATVAACHCFFPPYRRHALFPRAVLPMVTTTLSSLQNSFLARPATRCSLICVTPVTRGARHAHVLRVDKESLNLCLRVSR